MLRAGGFWLTYYLTLNFAAQYQFLLLAFTMLKFPVRPLLRHAPRPISAVSRLPIIPVNKVHSSKSKQQNESNSQSHHREAPRRPVLLASALSATATTVGGALLLVSLGYGSTAVEDESKYASRRQMELVSRTWSASFGSFSLTSSGSRRNQTSSRGRCCEHRR